MLPRKKSTQWRAGGAKIPESLLSPCAPPKIGASCGCSCPCSLCFSVHCTCPLCPTTTAVSLLFFESSSSFRIIQKQLFRKGDPCHPLFVCLIVHWRKRTQDPPSSLSATTLIAIASPSYRVRNSHRGTGTHQSLAVGCAFDCGLQPLTQRETRFGARATHQSTNNSTQPSRKTSSLPCARSFFHPPQDEEFFFRAAIKKKEEASESI